MMQKTDPTSFLNISREKGVSFIHMNVRSLFPKIDQIRAIFQDSKIGVVTISETWLNHRVSDSMINIEGYTMYRQDRSTHSTGDKSNNNKKRGGGLVTYINKAISCDIETLTKLENNTKDLESQWLKIKRRNAKNIIICNLYRPPAGKFDKAMKFLNNNLGSIDVERAELFIMGDFNVDYKNKKSVAYRKLTFLEKKHSLSQIIKNNTRTTKKTSKLLHIILTNAKYISKSGTVDTFISDHQPIYAIKKKIKMAKSPENFRGRSYRKYNENDFKANLQNKNWDDFYNSGEIETKWSILLANIELEADKQCPLRNFRINSLKPDYITNELIEQMKDRDYFYRKAKRTKHEDDWRIAQRLRNQTNSNIRAAKADYIIEKLNEHEGDSPKFWRTIKSVFPSKKGSKRQNIIKLKDRGIEIPHDDTADFINNYFLNIGKLNIPIPPAPAPSLTNDDDEEDLDTPPLELKTVTSATVYRLVKELKISKSSGPVDLSMRLVKDALLALAEQLTSIINHSITTSTFPEAWKKAKLHPYPNKVSSQMSQILGLFQSCLHQAK